MKTKDFKMDIKSVNDDGTFEGYLSVFGVVDLGNDIMEAGAFTKTLQESGNKFVMLWQHDTKQPIGEFEAEQDEYGLKVRGKLIMGLKQAQEALVLLKAGVIKGLSIGYKSIKDQVVKGIRHLKEVQLYEGSIVTFPMLPLAQIDLGSVKAMGQRKDFLAELAEAQMCSMRGMMLNSLYCSLDDALYGAEGATDAAGIIQSSQDSIDQFAAAYMENLPKLLEMYGVKAIPTEEKAGRRLSSASQTMITEAITKLQALLAEENTSEEPEAELGMPKAATQEPATPEPEISPEIHLMLKNFTFKSIKEN